MVTEALHEHGPAQAAKDNCLTGSVTSPEHKVRKILDTTQEPSPALAMRTKRLEEKIAKLKDEMPRLEALEAQREE